MSYGPQETCGPEYVNSLTGFIPEMYSWNVITFCRFRVVDETFVDTTPTGPESATDVPPEVKTEAENKKSPYTMVVRALKYVLT